MKKCQLCQGQKFILGMGSMREICKQCSGTGFLKHGEIVETISKKNSHLKNNEKGNLNVGKEMG